MAASELRILVWPFPSTIRRRRLKFLALRLIWRRNNSWVMALPFGVTSTRLDWCFTKSIAGSARSKAAALPRFAKKNSKRLQPPPPRSIQAPIPQSSGSSCDVWSAILDQDLRRQRNSPLLCLAAIHWPLQSQPEKLLHPNWWRHLDSRRDFVPLLR